MLGMDNKMVTVTKVETNKKVKTLIILTKSTQVGCQKIHVDTTVLFLRLINVIVRAEDTMKYFSYEQTPIPTSLFKGNFMWHPEKSQLADALIHYRRNTVQKERKKKTMRSVESDGPARKKKKRNDDTTKRDEQNKCEEEESTSNNKEESTTGMVTVDKDDKAPSQHSKIIVDKGHLLHRLFWTGQMYEDVIKCHLSYVTLCETMSNYGTANMAKCPPKTTNMQDKWPRC